MRIARDVHREAEDMAASGAGVFCPLSSVLRERNEVPQKQASRWMSHHGEGFLAAKKRMATVTRVLYKAVAFYDRMHLVSKQIAAVAHLFIKAAATGVRVVGEGKK